MLKTEDGTLVRNDGTVMVFSLRRFKEEIVEAGNCFICGRGADAVALNNEHIIPAWVLRRYRLHNASITLPNNTRFRYGQYTVPCCFRCNGLMGEVFEVPISAAFNGGLEQIKSFLSDPSNRSRMFVWLALLYFKTHLKDQSLRFHRDQRLSQGMIGDIYEGEHLYQAHCIVRSFLSGARVAPEVIGSLLVVPARDVVDDSQFDYADNYLGQSIMVRMGRVAVLGVLNDSGAVLRFRTDTQYRGHGRPLLDKITRPLSRLQLRELMIEFAHTNTRMEIQPTFGTLIDLDTELCEIVAQTPDHYSLREGDAKVFGEMLYTAIRDVLESCPEPARGLVSGEVRSGVHTFLWASDGTQIDSVD